MIAERDFRDPHLIVAGDAGFYSPAGLKPYLGRDLLCLMLSTAAGIFEDFKCHRKLVDGENAVLEFSVHIGHEQPKPVHIFRFNAAGEFSDIEKMVRPIKAAKVLGDALGAKIRPQIKAMRAAGAV